MSPFHVQKCPLVLAGFSMQMHACPIAGIQPVMYNKSRSYAYLTD